MPNLPSNPREIQDETIFKIEAIRSKIREREKAQRVEPKQKIRNHYNCVINDKGFTEKNILRSGEKLWKWENKKWKIGKCERGKWKIRKWEIGKCEI